MRVAFEIRELIKLYPLAISRGVMASSENLFVTVTDGTLTGIGELSPATGSAWTAERGQSQLEAFAAQGMADSPHDNYSAMREAMIDPPAMAALDVALWDLLAKQAGMPLYRLLGLPKRGVPTSVTIGINPPEVTLDRVPKIISGSGAKALKIKLGSPEGREHDKAHFIAAATAAKPFGVSLRVDANGGWTVEEAIAMIQWLKEQGVEYVEQPLAEGQEEGLVEVFKHRALPIFVDESIRFSTDVPKVACRRYGPPTPLLKSKADSSALSARSAV